MMAGLAAILSALALWGGLLGAVGHYMAGAATAVAGATAAATIPVLVALVAWSMLAGRPGSAVARAVVAGGFFLAVVAAFAGLGAHPGSSGSALAGSPGGAMGGLIAELLRMAVGVLGAVIVLVAIGVLSVLHLFGVPVSRAIEAVRRAASWSGSKLSSAGAQARKRRAGTGESEPTRPAKAQTRTPTPSHGEISFGGMVAGADPVGDPPAAEPATEAVATPAAGPVGVPEVAEELPIPEQASTGVRPDGLPWSLPPLKLLRPSLLQAVDKEQLKARGHMLEQALAAHGVETRLVGLTAGPTVTRYELELGSGVKVARVTSLQKDIAYAMASPDVRILAPIPGRSAIGVEVPNPMRQVVALADLLGSAEARAATHPLQVPLGRDIAGRPVMVNLAEMPHVLIAGATGSGKSSAINSVITSVLMSATPAEVRLILVDPKRVELGQYDRLPHLLASVVVNPKLAANALNWAVKEMERRYDQLAFAGFRDIGGYNEAVGRGEVEDLVGPDGEAVAAAKLHYILVVVDELNDLMMVAARDVEQSICRLAQMARAVGIHLLIATQRPSVDVITGVIKANVPSRMAFSVSSLADSRVILDQGGAERLVGRGDMLFVSASSSEARRLQSPWVSEAEVAAVVAHWRRQSPPRYQSGVEGEEQTSQSGEGEEEGDELLAQAMELVVRSGLGSTSMLQRKLRVGFSRAGRLMDLLERRGVVGPSEGSKARAVLMTAEELDASREATEAAP